MGGEPVTGLRLTHRLCAVTAHIGGAVTIAAEFTDKPMPYRAAVMWMAGTVGVILTDRRMKSLARRTNETSEENR